MTEEVDPESAREGCRGLSILPTGDAHSQPWILASGSDQLNLTGSTPSPSRHSGGGRNPGVGGLGFRVLGD